MNETTLAAWHEFYALLGAAAATLVALLFVAASVGAGVFTAGRPAGLRFFLSATVVNFATILVTALIVLAPLGAAQGAFIVACGLYGLIYYAFAWREIGREGILGNVDLEDRSWYGVLPVIGHLVECAAGVGLALGAAVAPSALAGASGLLLVVGVHNAWDITVWVVTKKTGG